MDDKKHFDDGYWRLYIDGDTEDMAAALAHLEECAGCRGVVDRLTSNKEAVAKSLTIKAPATIPEWLPESEHSAVSRQTIFKTAAAASAFAIALTFMLLPPARSLAGEVLQLFRAEKFEAIKIDPQAMSGFDPGQMGEFNLSEPQGEEVATIAEAEQKTGLKLTEPGNLPPGLPRSVMHVTTEGKMSLVFDLKKFSRYLRERNFEDTKLPDSLDDTTLTVTMPPVVMMEYSASGNNADASLVVAQAGLPKVEVAEGVDFEVVRDELLKMPIFPPEVREQLANIQDWKRTLPIPYPGDQAESEKVVVGDGRDGLYFQGNEGQKILIWTNGDQAYGLIAPPRSSLTRADLFSIARTL